MVGGRGNAMTGVVCRVKAVVRRVLARRAHAHATWARVRLAVNTRGGPQTPHKGPGRGCEGPAERAEGAARVHRGGPARAGRQAAVEKPTRPRRVSRPRTRERDRRFAVGLRFEYMCAIRDEFLRMIMMVHEFECAQYGAPCINS